MDLFSLSVSVFPESPGLGPLLQIPPPKCQVQRKNHLPRPACFACTNIAQHIVNLHCCQGALLIYAWLAQSFSAVPLFLQS